MSPNQIRAIRGFFNLTQQELGDQLGVSQNTVARWESGLRNPSGPATRLLKQMWERMQGEQRAA